MALSNKQFCLTGTFPALVSSEELAVVDGRLNVGRAEATKRILAHGGVVKGSLSSKTAYLVVGKLPGAAKIEKASKLPDTMLIDLKGVDELIAGGQPSPPSIDSFSSGFDGNAIDSTRGRAAVDKMLARGKKRGWDQ